MIDIATFNYESQASMPFMKQRLSMKNEERKIERVDVIEKEALKEYENEIQ